MPRASSPRRRPTLYEYATSIPRPSRTFAMPNPRRRVSHNQLAPRRWTIRGVQVDPSMADNEGVYRGSFDVTSEVATPSSPIEEPEHPRATLQRYWVLVRGSMCALCGAETSCLLYRTRIETMQGPMWFSMNNRHVLYRVCLFCLDGRTFREGSGRNRNQDCLILGPRRALTRYIAKNAGETPISYELISSDGWMPASAVLERYLTRGENR